jgi:Ca-activated chloride channel family protein
MLEWHSLEWVWPRLLWLQLLVPIVWLSWLAWRFVRSHWFTAKHDASTATQWFQVPQQRISKWKSVVIAALLYGGCALMLLSVARPKAVLLLPTRLDGVMLAIDSSGSMRAQDVLPSRIEVAQQIATRLIDTLPSQVKLGVVSMAGTASLVQTPSEDRDDLRRAIDALTLQPGSAVGSGLIIALDAMLPASGIDVRKLIEEGESARGVPAAPEAKPLTPQSPALHPAHSPIASASPTVQKLDPGSNKSQAIVLITDGQGNLGPDPIKMAQIAADLGVRVYTIGVGTTQGTVLKARGMQARVKLDEEVLKRIADMTAGEYFRADSSLKVDRIYQQLSMKISLKKHRQNEVTVLFALLGMGLLLLSAMLRFRQSGRVI